MHTERRNEDRQSTRGSVRFEMSGQARFGIMRNLSQFGCMIESGGVLAEVGERCEIALLPGYVVSGRVAWQLGEALGISFHQPILPSLVREYALDDWPMRTENKHAETLGPDLVETPSMPRRSVDRSE